MKKAWGVKKIKEENVGDDFPDQCMASACGIAMARRGEHPMRALGAHSTGHPPRSCPVAHGGTWQHVPQRAVARGGTPQHVPQHASCTQLGRYCSTGRAGALWQAVAHKDRRHGAHRACSSTSIVTPSKRAYMWCVCQEDPAH